MNNYLEKIAIRSGGIEAESLQIPLLLPDKLIAFGNNMATPEDDRFNNGATEEMNVDHSGFLPGSFKKENSNLSKQESGKATYKPQQLEGGSFPYLKAQAQRQYTLPLTDSAPPLEKKTIDLLENNSKTIPLKPSQSGNIDLTATNQPKKEREIQSSKAEAIILFDDKKKTEQVLPQQMPGEMNELPFRKEAPVKIENRIYEQLMPATEKKPEAFTTLKNPAMTKLVIGRITVEVIHPPKQVIQPKERIIVRKQESIVKNTDSASAGKFYFGLRQL